jgi:copper chaperone CopZ
MVGSVTSDEKHKVAPPATGCPGCGAQGKPVRSVTLCALLKPEFAAGVAEAEHRFCAAPGCDVVYYGPSGVYTKAQMTVAVGVKEATGERPLCYCFGHSVATIQAEFREKGRSTAPDDIRRRMDGCGCACETTNPSGACCLGAVVRGVEVAWAESERTCEGCSAFVTRALRGVPGVRWVEGDYAAGRVVVASDADAPPPTEAILHALEQTGFPGEVAKPR